MVVERHAQQVATAIGQATDRIATQAQGRDALVKHVVCMLAHRDNLALRPKIMLVLARQVTGLVMKPLQLACGVDRLDQLVAAIVGKALGLRPVTYWP